MSATDLTARPYRDARDGETVAMALRHGLRWRTCGLGLPPDLQLFEAPVRYLWPRPREDVHLEAVLVFGTRRDGHGVVGVLVHAGWSNDRDRTRVGELVVLDSGQNANAVLETALGALFAGGATAVRFVSDGLAAAAAPFGRPQLDAEGKRWVHVARSSDFVDRPADDAVADRDIAVLGAFGPGGWPLRANRPVVPRVRPSVHDPSVAHLQLLKSSPRLRPWFYPRGGGDAETDVVIIGAGIAGLTAAYALRPRACLVLEREARVGGTARAHDGPAGRLGVGAHYEHEPDPRFAPEILALYEELGITRRDAGGRHVFVDAQHYIDVYRHEQSVRPDGNVRANTWQLFETTAEGRRMRETMLRYDGRLPVPTRLADDEMRAFERSSFSQWIAAHGCSITGELAHGIDVILRSDYGVGSERTSAFAALHFFLCRPYLRSGARTFAPPEGLSYVTDRLLQRTKNAGVRLSSMARRITPHADHVEVDVIDLRERRSYTVRAKAVVFAAPKKSLKYLYRPDAHLFARNDYASWITVSCEHAFGAERDMLCWTNHTYDPRPEHVGFTWMNHAQHDANPVLGHYLAYEQAAQALVASSRVLVRDSMAHASALLGVDASKTLRNVIIEKFGHAMPKPLPGTLFVEANARRGHERVVYAGVDTGRLPIMAEAFDSGLEAAKALASVR